MLPPTPEQQLAIDHEGGNLLILACAGSGKTETLARRIARMIRDGVDRGSIVAFTFTEHAATELKQRIRAKLEEALPNEPALGDMYVGTIHSFCLRVLRENEPKYRQYEVMDDARQAALIATNFTRFEDSGTGIGLDRLRGRTRSKTYGETLRMFVSTLNIIFQQKVDVEAIGDSVLVNAVKAYDEISAGYPNFFFDFNKIINELIYFLEKNPKVLKNLRVKLSHIFVDEYQDVDDRQEELIWLLSNGGKGPEVTVVGDDDQALYGFRGASVQNILRFEKKYPKPTRVTLSENFRSTHAIVSVADEAIKLINERIEKEPVARRIAEDGTRIEHLGDKGDIQLHTCASEEEEADWVVQRIKALRGVAYRQKNGEVRGLDYGDMAILLRSVRSSGSVFAEVLRGHDIPVVISGTAGLFNNDEIRLVQASFSLLSRSEFALPDESGRIELLTTVDTREFVRSSIKALRETGRFGSYANHTRYLSWIDKVRADLDQRSLKKGERGRKGARIYPQSLYQEMLATLGAGIDEWPVDLMFNFGAFSELLSQFEAVHQWITPARLKNLTLYLSNWAAKHVDEGGLSELSSLNSVKIMTVHSAKGLEWPVVFLPRVSSRIFPSSMRTRGPDCFLADDAYNKNVYIGGDDGERRLWYVALTRCEKFLNISSLKIKGKKKPTSYFNDIEHDCVCYDGKDPTLREYLEPQPPVGSELLPTTYSDLSAFWRCQYEYQLRSLMDFSPGVGEQFGYGQQIHNILAEIHQRAIAGNKTTEKEVDSLVDERFHLRYTRGDPLDAMKLAAKRALKNYINKFGEQVLKARAFEKPFEFVDQQSGAMISGVVDLLESGDQSLPPSQREIVGLVDFKAKKIKSNEEYEQLERNVSEQLQLYAVGVKYALSKEPGSAAAHIISHSPLPESVTAKGKNERIPIDISDSAQQEALARVAETVSDIREKISTQEFGRTGVSSGKCKYCDYRVFCKGYKEYSSQDKNEAVNSTPVESAEKEVDELMEEMNAGQKS